MVKERNSIDKLMGSIRILAIGNQLILGYIMFERWLQRDKVHAIHEKDMEKVIRELGLSENILSGELLCSECGKQINIESIQCIYMQDEDLKICCNGTDCYKSLMDRRKR